METLRSEGLLLLSAVVDKLARVCDRRITYEIEAAVIQYHGVRALGLLKGIRCLVESDYSREALVLNRSLLNLFIDLAWLTSGYSQVRIQWFVDGEVLTRRAQGDALLRMGKISEAQHRKEVGVYQQEWDEFRKKYGYYWNNQTPPSNWAPHINDMAYSLSTHPDWKFLWKDYEASYRYLSSNEHTDPRAVLEYLEKDGGECYPRRVTDITETLLIETCRYGIGVLSICGQRLSMSQDLSKLFGELGRLQSELRGVEDPTES